MSQLTLSQLSEKMRDIDFAMLTTRTENGELATRPMSNNREVAYDGDSYYFAEGTSRIVADIERDAKVGLAFTGNKGLMGKPPLFIAVQGSAELIRDKAAFEKHWTPDLERWFAQGADTPGLTLIKVHASRIHFWDGEDEGELSL